MKLRAKSFEFVSYKIDPKNRKVFFNYKIEFANREPLNFSESIIFPAPFSLKNIPPKFLKELFSNLHLILGISYYKLYCPPKIKLNIALSKKQADFWNTIYQKGLGEFFYVNKIDFRKLVKFPYDKKANPISSFLPRKN